MARRGDNICIIELNEGPVTIKLTMPDNIMCGGDFKVYDQSRNNVIEQFKMSANPGEFAIANISTWPRDLNKCFLAWTVLCCSNTASVYKGVFQYVLSSVVYSVYKGVFGMFSALKKIFIICTVVYIMGFITICSVYKTFFTVYVYVLL